MNRNKRASRLLAHGRLQSSGEAYMVTEPLGTHLDQSCSAACIIQVICDIAETIIKNSEEDPPILHRDISAANIIMTHEDSGGRGLLIDYQVAGSFELARCFISIDNFPYCYHESLLVNRWRE